MITRSAIWEGNLTRSIPPSLAGVVEQLELERPTLVTSEHLARLVSRSGIRSPVATVAARLREKGWLLPTGRRGVWEFAPAAVAGAYSRGDPLMPLAAFLSQHPDARCALTFQTAAWAQGIADRVPTRIEVASATRNVADLLPDIISASVFDNHLTALLRKGVPALSPPSILVHMATRPSAVRSWASAFEWLPDLSAELTWQPLATELAERPAATRARAGYLLQGLRPDLAEQIRDLGPLHGKTWFGPHGPLRRHDNAWQIADTLLPTSPRSFEPRR
jgi:hypothetical protein